MSATGGILSTMLVTDHIAALRHEGTLLAEAAERAGMEAGVPSCPRWTVATLLAHTGMIHRWATRFVAEGLKTHQEPTAEAKAPPSDPGALLSWYRDGHRRLVQALETAPADLDCWFFLDAPSPLAFWARRQAHETAIHRADAELASGPVTPYPPHFAADGIDELLGGFMSGRRSGRLRLDPPRSIALHAADVDRDWVLHVGPDGTVLDRVPGGADCTVAGGAGDLYLLMWNRAGADVATVTGDGSMLDWWRGEAKVRWS